MSEVPSQLESVVLSGKARGSSRGDSWEFGHVFTHSFPHLPLHPFIHSFIHHLVAKSWSGLSLSVMGLLPHQMGAHLSQLSPQYRICPDQDLATK